MKKYFTFILAALIMCLIFTGSAFSQPVRQVKDMYPYPSIPDSLTTVGERAEYFVAHYWDNYNFSDTALLELPFLTEQGVVDFIDILPLVPQDIAAGALTDLVAKSEATPQTFEHFTGLLDKYLYHPGSPMRNDEYYIQVLERMLYSNIPTEPEKEALRYRLKNAEKNRAGTQAEDFRFTVENGKTYRMRKLKSDFTLLMFYNPDCHTCEEVTKEMMNSPVIKEMTADKRLAILAVYPDNDVQIWKKHLRKFPSAWINGYDKDGKIDGDLYYIRTIPALYLLDKDKYVLLKDASFESIENKLKESEQRPEN